MKRVSHEQGYGYIACTELATVFGCDVFVHKQQLQNFVEGQEVTFAVCLNKENKPQAFELLPEVGRVGEGSLAPPRGPLMPGMHVPPMLGMQMGMTPQMMPMGGCGIMPMTATGPLPPGPKPKPKEELLGRFRGVIKSYSQDRGFGFVACPELSNQGMAGDVYLHHSHIQSCQVGQEVSFDVFLLNGRPQCRNLEDSTGQLPPEAVAAIAAGNSNETVLGSFTGQIKSFNPVKGFGFICSDELTNQNRGDAYLHAKHAGGFNAGDHVSFTAYLFNGKLQARDLVPAQWVQPSAGVMAQAQAQLSGQLTGAGFTDAANTKGFSDGVSRGFSDGPPPRGFHDAPRGFHDAPKGFSDGPPAPKVVEYSPPNPDPALQAAAKEAEAALKGDAKKPRLS